MIAKIAQFSQIDSRYTVLEDPCGFYRFNTGETPGTEARMKVYASEAPKLALEAAIKVVTPALREAITHVVVSTCTGFVAPGLESYLIAHLRLRPETKRLTLGFMGCSAGLTAYEAASQIVIADPGSTVLVVACELCSLHLQKPGPEVTADARKVRALGFAQFADGAAASIVSAKSEGLRIGPFRSTIFPEFAEYITWKIGDQGFEMHLAVELPKTIEKRLVPRLPHLHELARDPSFLWAIHPGGRAIVSAVQNGLALADDRVALSRQVLAQNGNMSSATLPFVLRETMHAGIAGQGLAIGFGPGLLVEQMHFELV